MASTSPEATAGNGDLTVAGTPAEFGGAGQVVLDARPVPIWATITSCVSGNRYSFVRADDFDAPTFRELAGAPETGVPLYEVNGRDDAPIGSKVRAWPGGGDTAFYLFALADTLNGSSAAVGCGWLAGLRDTHCLEVAIVGEGGACDCESTPANQRLRLTSANGLVWLGGTAGSPGGTGGGPGCPDPCFNGSAGSYAVVLAAGTGAWAGAPTNWALSPLGSCVYTQTQGDWTLQFGFFAGERRVILTKAGGAVTFTRVSTAAPPNPCCGTIPGPYTVSTTTDADPPAVTSVTGDCSDVPPVPASGLTVCGAVYTARFTKGDCHGPCLTLTATGSAGSGSGSGSGSGGPAAGTVFTGTRESCGPNWAVFAFGDPALCTGTAGCGGPAANVLRIKVAWVPCLWDGPGWYCVADCEAGTAGACAAVELLEGDQYRADISICSGPYADEAAAWGTCPPAATPITLAVTCPASSGGAVGTTYEATYTVPPFSYGGYVCMPVSSSTTYHLTYTATSASSLLTISGANSGCVESGALLVNLNPTGNLGCVSFTTGPGDVRLCIRLGSFNGDPTTVAFSITPGVCP